MSFQKCIQLTHRWIGLTAGALFVLMGLTGSYLVFKDPIDAAAKASLKRSTGATVATGSEGRAPVAASLEAVIRSAQAGVGTRLEPASVRAVADPSRNIEVLFNLAAPGAPRRWITAYVDPQGARFAGQEEYRNTVSGRIFSLHHDLMLGEAGHTALGVAGLLFTLLLLGGLLLWLRARRWSPLALRRASGARLPLELHKLAGIYGIALASMAAGTGVYLSKPAWFGGEGGGEKRAEGGLRKERAGKGERAPEVAAETPVDYARLEARILEQGALERPWWIRIDAKAGTAQVTSGPAEPPKPRKLDLASGEWLAPEKRGAEPARAGLRATIMKLHTGRYWGPIGSALAFLTGWLPLLFYVTGFLLWRRKAARNRTPRAANSPKLTAVRNPLSWPPATP